MNAKGFYLLPYSIALGTFLL